MKYPSEKKIAQAIQEILKDNGALPIERCTFAAQQILGLFPERDDWVKDVLKDNWLEEAVRDFTNDDS